MTSEKSHVVVTAGGLVETSHLRIGGVSPLSTPEGSHKSIERYYSDKHSNVASVGPAKGK